MCNLKCEDISSYGKRRIFLKIAHWHGLTFFDNYHFIRTKNLKTSPESYLENYVTNPYSISFLSVLHQNKALHNFDKRDQRLIATHIKGPEVWKFSHKLFCEKKYQLLLCPNDIYTLWLLITLCNMPKDLVTKLEGNHRQPCIHGCIHDTCCMSH